MIQTVTGPADRGSLGRVLAHEHLLIDLSVFAPPPEDKSIPYREKLSLSNLRYVRKDPYLILDNAIMDETDTAIEEMKLFRAAGGGTVVDATLDTIGRDPLALRRISEESGVNIVMGCGFYVAASHPAYVRERTERELAEEILRDLTEGVRGTGIRAGVIGEIGTSAVVTPEEWKCVAAAGIAQRESGKGIHIHTSLYERNGIAVADKLLAMGVPPQKICIDHVDVDIREDYIKQLLDKGIYVEFDNFGKEYYISKREGNALNGRFAYDLERAQTIARLLGAGYGKQILLCNDICLKNMLICCAVTAVSAMRTFCRTSARCWATAAFPTRRSKRCSRPTVPIFSMTEGYKMKLIDCSACIGLGGINREIVNHEDYIVREAVKEPRNARELLAEMDRNGIDEAVVYHQAMVDVSPQYGNGKLLEGEPLPRRLHATMAVAPSVSDPEFEPEKILCAAKKYRLAGVRAWPQLNRYMLDGITCGDLLDLLCRTKLPLYLTPMKNWEHIFAVLKEFPALRVIITNYGLWGSDRYFYPLVRAYPGVYVDTSDMQEIRGIEAFVNKFGSERLLFGTNYPMDNMGGPIASLFGAKISESDRENIAHRNIERLWSEVNV